MELTGKKDQNTQKSINKIMVLVIFHKKKKTTIERNVKYVITRITVRTLCALLLSELASFLCPGSLLFPLNSEHSNSLELGTEQSKAKL